MHIPDLRRLMQPMRLWPAGPHTPRRATWSELFFDLIFVAAVSEAGTSLSAGFALGVGIAALVWIASAFAEAPQRYRLWTLALAIDFATSWLAERRGMRVPPARRTRSRTLRPVHDRPARRMHCRSHRRHRLAGALAAAGSLHRIRRHGLRLLSALTLLRWRRRRKRAPHSHAGTSPPLPRLELCAPALVPRFRRRRSRHEAPHGAARRRTPPPHRGRRLRRLARGHDGVARRCRIRFHTSVTNSLAVIADAPSSTLRRPMANASRQWRNITR